MNKYDPIINMSNALVESIKDNGITPPSTWTPVTFTCLVRKKQGIIEHKNASITIGTFDNDEHIEPGNNQNTNKATKKYTK